MAEPGGQGGHVTPRSHLNNLIGTGCASGPNKGIIHYKKKKEGRTHQAQAQLISFDTLWLFGLKEVGESEKVGNVIFHFHCPSKCQNKKMKKTPFPFLFSFLHNHFLTFKVLQLIL